MPERLEPFRERVGERRAEEERYPEPGRIERQQRDARRRSAYRAHREDGAQNGTDAGGPAEAECEAMQHDAAMAHLLGASPATGQHLAETYYRDMYPRMREGYTSGECRKGGHLDATPGDGIWP